MRDVGWRLALTMVALALLACLGSSLGCSRGSRLIEWLTGQTPQARIEAYLEAAAGGETGAALAQWLPPDKSQPELAARRQAVTASLMTRGRRLNYHLLDFEWWSTCCEPRIVDDPGEAGFVRVRVAVEGGNQSPAVYVFDLMVPGGYWGAAAGYPVRQWAIVDIYAEGQPPLVWIWQ
jgi:hypothetical protein